MNSKSKSSNVMIVKEATREQYKEVLLDNRIDEDIQSVLRPLNLVQNIFLCAKYSIKDNYITSNSLCYNCCSVFSTVLYICFLTLLLLGILAMFYWNFAILTLFLRHLYQCFSCFVVYGVNVAANIIHMNNNVFLVLKIQYAYRILEIKRDHFKSLAIVNWICVVVLNFLYFLEKFEYNIDFVEVKNRIVGSLVTYPNVLFEINIVYAIVIINLLRRALNIWMERVRKLTCEEMLRERNWNEMFKVYSSVLEAYTLCEQTFRLIVRFILYSIRLEN